MHNIKRNSHYYQTLNKVTEMIKQSPSSILFRVFEISPQTIASFKAKELSHRQLCIAAKELSFFLNNSEVKLPLRHCPYCTSTRVLQVPESGSDRIFCRCLTCKREYAHLDLELEGGDVK